MTATRRTRADGEATRRRILEAAAELAGERGFDGASIAAISERSGAPKSSIYHHFEDKDRLIEAVIDDSYQQWIERIKQVTTPDDHVRLSDGFGSSISAITDAPDFLRLGLMLSLDQRETPTPARKRFVEIRAEVQATLRRLFSETFPELDATAIAALARLAMAIIDGFFIAEQTGEARLDRHHGLIEHAVVGAAARLATTD